MQIYVDKKKILRYLGYPLRSQKLIDHPVSTVPHPPPPPLCHLGYKKSAKVDNNIIEKVEKMVRLSYSLINPQWNYKIFQSSKVKKISLIFPSSEKIALCILTIGEDLEKKVKELTVKGNLTDAVILDCVGSVIVEEVATKVNEIIRDEALQKGLIAGKRKSPGYGKFYLYLQKEIFDLIDGRKIGVSLNEKFMMIPRKSVSFGLPIKER